jgi:hypothetical protein
MMYALCNLGEIKGHNTQSDGYFTCRISAGGIVTLTQAYQKQRAAPFLSFVFFSIFYLPFL